MCSFHISMAQVQVLAWRWLIQFQKVTLTFPGFRYIKTAITPTLHSLLDYCKDLSFILLLEYFFKGKNYFFPPLFKSLDRFLLLLDEATENVVTNDLAYYVSSLKTVLHFILKAAMLVLVLTFLIHPLLSALGPLHRLCSLLEIFAAPQPSHPNSPLSQHSFSP